MIKLTGYFILLMLISTTVGFDKEEILEGQQKRVNNFRKRLQSPHHEDDLLVSLFSEAKRHSLRGNTATIDDDAAPANIQDPVRIAIFNAGSFSVHLKLNYVMNGQQIEDEISSDIKSNEHRSLFVPDGATYVRIRVQLSDSNPDQTFIDEQIDLSENPDGACYILAHTKSHPVYGLCANSYGATLQAWGVSK